MVISFDALYIIFTNAPRKFFELLNYTLNPSQRSAFASARGDVSFGLSTRGNTTGGSQWPSHISLPSSSSIYLALSTADFSLPASTTLGASLSYTQLTSSSTASSSSSPICSLSSGYTASATRRWKDKCLADCSSITFAKRFVDFLCRK